jgi:carbon starvation protein
MRRISGIVVWSAVAILGAGALGMVAFARGEHINAAWLLTAALCSYAVGYRFYSRLIARNVFALDDARPTPAVRLENGHDFLPTHPAVVFGHHFAAIAGAGPLMGPVVAAQFGYLPGALWIIVGVVLGGAVQDFVILIASMRRDGRSLGQLAREEIGAVGGWMALFGVFAIVLLLTAVLALVVVRAMASSPWSVVTLGLTIPIALIMGMWMRWVRPGRILEASIIGIALLGVALWAGERVADSSWHDTFSLKPETLCWWLIGYGLVASVLPVWMLLAPRDYLSAFVKLGTVALLAVGIFLVLPPLQMPALVERFAGGGPLAPGSIFPFAFITVACGAISGFHALVASGTTPKLIARERQARPIGYGAMLMESFVAILALIAACSMTPGLFFAINAPAAQIGTTAEHAAGVISSWGQAFTISAGDITAVAHSIHEQTVMSRPGGATCLAVGMARIFSSVFASPAAMAWWYHFAILFEALFILTTIDAGTRVGRFILQDLVGHAWPRFRQVSWPPAVILASAAVAAGWGWLLYGGVIDENGGIKTLWPVFGMANQVLAAIALCVGTAVMVRMGRARWAWITVAPLLWLVAVTETAGWQMLTSGNPALGFGAKVAQLAERAAAVAPGASHDDQVAVLHHLAWNARVDLVLCALFMIAILVIMADTARECWACLRGGRLRGSAPPQAAARMEAA